jgi:hypothetical protein
MELQIVTIAERPELRDGLWSPAGSWPEFMYHDLVGALMEDLPRWCPDLQLVALDQAGTVVGKAQAIPVAWDRPIAQLPARGWDEMLVRGSVDHRAGRTPTLASALEITMWPGSRRRGGSSQLLGALRGAVAARGLNDLVAPVRPIGKHTEPHTPMDAYARRVRDDGLPADGWLRVHARAGAELIGVASCAMSIVAPLEDWRRWTGLPFDRSGDVVVPHALVPVHASVDHDQAAYVEPNVWMHHRV